MPNNIKAAEILEERIADLKSLLKKQEKLAKTLADGALDTTIQGTKELIRQNEATAKFIRKTAIDG